MNSECVDGKVILDPILVKLPLVHHAASVMHQHVQLLVLHCKSLGPRDHLSRLGQVHDMKVDFLEEVKNEVICLIIFFHIFEKKYKNKRRKKSTR